MTGIRLDKHLLETKKGLGFSRSQWQKIIKGGSVRVNGTPVKVPHHEIHPHDIIEIKEGGAPKNIPKPPKTEKQKRKNKSPKIIAETDGYAVIDKPAGLMVHPANSSATETTLVDFVLAKYPDIKKIKNDEGEDSQRPGIVHRLDRETSGAIIVAKTQESFDSLRAQFKTRGVEKTYVALVHGKLTNDFGEINFPIGRTDSGRMAARPLGIKSELDAQQKGRDAKTKFKVIKQFHNFTLVEATPFTGRTHQIRVHFFAFGHPIVGDPLYQYKGKVGKNIPSPPRMMLHSKRVCFRNLAQERVCYTARVPHAMSQFIKEIPV